MHRTAVTVKWNKHLRAFAKRQRRSTKWNVTLTVESCSGQ